MLNFRVIMRIISAMLISVCVYGITTSTVLANSVTVVEQSSEHGNISVEYPQISGIQNESIAQKINYDIKYSVDKFIKSCQANEFLQEGFLKYKVHYTDNNKLSFEMIQYTYTGGAHGSSFIKGYTYDLQTGQQDSLTKEYDFRPSDINQRIFAYARDNDVFLFSDFQGIATYPNNYYLNEQGKPVILFQQYEIAPYSSGVIRVNMY